MFKIYSVYMKIQQLIVNRTGYQFDVLTMHILYYDKVSMSDIL